MNEFYTLHYSEGNEETVAQYVSFGNRSPAYIKIGSASSELQHTLTGTSSASLANLTTNQLSLFNDCVCFSLPLLTGG